MSLLRFEDVDDRKFDVVRLVVEELLKLGALEPDDLMIVGASCRDILHAALGYEFPLRGTTDVDVAIALPSWPPFEELTQQLQPAGDNGIPFLVQEIAVDLVPFGAVENPVGSVMPARRDADMNVFAFSEVFAHARHLPLAPDLVVRIPDPAGYCALKMSAWASRSADSEFRDGADIAAVIYWYAESPVIEERLYRTEEGIPILLAAEMDLRLAAAELLGRDLALLIGAERTEELAARWSPKVRSRLPAALGHETLPGWPADRQRREAMVEKLCSGVWA
jgi:predicted nucleotidyltransferase